MNAPSQRYRMTLLLFAGGILASAALVASQMTEGKTGNVVNAPGTSSAQEGPAFDEWAGQDPAPDERKGKLLGQVERNGEMVEVREAVPDEGHGTTEDVEMETAPEAGAEQDELAPQ